MNTQANFSNLSSVKIIAEIGINHNGSIDLAKELMSISKEAGCDYVKIQKRDPDTCVPEHQKNKMRDTPWGRMTYLEYKKRIEFNEEQIIELFDYAADLNIRFFASIWDIESARLMAKYTDIAKIPSALITNHELCKIVRSLFKTMIVSTGMSTESEVSDCIRVCDPDIIFHTNSTYPSDVAELNLNYIRYLKNKYPTKEIGYSGHEFGLVTTFATIPMGVKWIERHITLDRNMWGSDHMASVEPIGLKKLVKGIRDIEAATQYEEGPRILFESENIKKQSLRS
jgi:N-acetylneuraminate synthase